MYPTIEQTQFTFILVFTLVFHFSSFHRLDLVSAASPLGLSWFLPIIHQDVAWPEEKLYHRVSPTPLTVIEIDKIG
jgi:hypothetical protein